MSTPRVFGPDEVDELRLDLDQLVHDWATTSAGWSGPWRDVYDVVAFSIYTVHGSRINRTNRRRRLVRVGYRDPANTQLAGQSLGRAGLIVAGMRPAGALRAA